MKKNIIFQTAISLDDKIQSCDTIYWHGKYWLVPEWIVNTELKERQPIRIILVDDLPHQKSDGNPYHFVLNEPIPKEVFEGNKYETPYHIIYRPEIYYDVPERLN